VFLGLSINRCVWPFFSLSTRAIDRLLLSTGNNVFQRIEFRRILGWGGRGVRGRWVDLRFVQLLRRGDLARGVSTSAGSSVLRSGSQEAEQPVIEAVEQIVASEESGDVISIDVRDEGEQADLTEVQGYEWAPYEPRTHATRFRWGNDLGDLVERTKVFSDEVEDGFLRVKVCASNERVCHGKGAAKLEFFYVYACLFHDLGLTVPFAD